jgi:hypothetical protein
LPLLESRVFGNTATPVAEPVEDDVEEEEEEVPLERTEVVLIEKVQDDGAVARIIFTSGGEVDVYELEKLCDKVGKTLVRLVTSSCLGWEESAGTVLTRKVEAEVGISQVGR